jgi:hypothetical protein
VNLGLIIVSKIFTRFCLKCSEKSRLSCHDPYFLLYVLGELELKEYIKQNINSMDFDKLLENIKKRAKELYNKSLKQNFEYLIKEKNKQGSFDYRNYFRNKNDINSLKDELRRDYKKDKAKGSI